AAAADDDDPLPRARGGQARAMPLLMMASGLGPLMGVAALVFLYVPATLLVTLFDRVDSFSVAFGRDFGGLLVLTLSSFTAVFLPLGVLSIALGAVRGAGLPVVLVLALLGVCAFAVLMVLAVQTACGVSVGPAMGAVALSWLSF